MAIFFGLMAILIADYQGWLLPIQDRLDRPVFTYNFGKYQISAYVVLQSLLVVIVIGWITNWLVRLTDRRVGRMKNLHPSSKTLIQKILAISLYVVAGLMTINVIGIDLTSLSIIGGAVGIGLGFGLQKVASNFISGLILLFERSVKVGDLIEMQDGTLGFVRKNSARYTLIETTNKREIMIPNEQFIIDKVINWTLSNKQGRLDIAIGVSYDSDLELVQKILLEAATAHPAALTVPAPQCQLRSFSAYSVDFMMLVWISDVTTGRYSVQSEIMFDIWHRFKAAGIEIPYPKQELTIRSGTLTGETNGE
jgi:small-conductance mechanosensitive channel